MGLSKSVYEWVDVYMCNYIKVEIGWNLPPALKIVVSWKSVHPLLLPNFLYRISKFTWMSAHPRVSFVRLMECNCGVWEAQPQALCISELRNFVLYFTEGYYKTALRRWTYLMWCTLQATPRWLGAVQSVVVPSGHGLEAAGGSVVLWGHRVAVNMTWAFFLRKH